jgi:hypothetical protein
MRKIYELRKKVGRRGNRIGVEKVNKDREEEKRYSVYLLGIVLMYRESFV